MKTRRPHYFLSLFVLLLPGALAAQGNCLNFSSFGTVTPDPFGALTTISTCSFESEYSTVNGCIAGASYQFTLSSGGYITVREGTFDGPVIGQGFSPVTVTATQNGTLFPHWTVNDQCITQSNCVVTTVQLFLNCAPPVVNYSVLDDCNTNSFTITVNITGLGDAPFVNLIYQVVGGSPVTIPNLGTGQQILGPFTVGQVVNIIVEHPVEPACNVLFNNVQSTGNCPIILTCGGPNYDDTYCYGPSDFKTWWYQSSGGQPLAILFSSGTIESSTWDRLTFYDGPNDQSPILWDHQGPTFDLTGLLVVSTGPNIFMKMTSDPSVQCSTTPSWTWNWTVGCLDCTVPEATFQVVPDCIHLSYFVEVDVTSTGSANSVTVITPVIQDTVANLPVGQHLIGPIPMGTPAVLGVYNGDNSLCRFFSPAFNYAPDSCIIQTCGFLGQTYCYTNEDDAWFLYQSTSNQQLTIRFFDGQLLTGDKIIIYNGLNDMSAVLFNGNLGGNLSGLTLNSSNADFGLALRVRSNAAGSCQDGQATVQMNWDISCGEVGMEEGAVGDFALYPNPTNGLVTLRPADGSMQDAVVQLLDVSGRVISEEIHRTVNTDGLRMDLSHLHNGHYLVRIATPEWVRTRSLQVLR